MDVLRQDRRHYDRRARDFLLADALSGGKMRAGEPDARGLFFS
jgi:hypothetical protein